MSNLVALYLILMCLAAPDVSLNFAFHPILINIVCNDIFLQLFEGMKSYRGEDGTVRMFRPEVNMHRMNMSAERATLPVSMLYSITYMYVYIYMYIYIYVYIYIYIYI